jgi:tetratricopeptide (TPR) repeat protein
MAIDEANRAAPAYLDTHAAALAELGRYPEAIRVQQRALEILQKAGVQGSVIAPFEEHLSHYQRGMPLRDP